MQHSVYVGIDVSLATLAVARISPEAQLLGVATYPNTPSGIKRLVKQLQQLPGTAHACLEPTSAYHLLLAQALHAAAGISISCANPRAVRNFARSKMIRAKTDALDARVLAEYALTLHPAVWQPPREICSQLRTLSRHLQSLAKRRTALKNQLHSHTHGANLPVVINDIKLELRALKRRTERLAQTAVELVNSDPALAQHFRLLLSTTGIGQVSALRILAEVCVLPAGLSKQQWVAAAGLDPMAVESGTSISKRRRISKQGNVHLRSALNIPALVAAHHCPEVKQYYQKLQARGCAKMAALCAVMRKLLQAIWGMFHSNTPFNPALFCQPTR